MVRRAQDRSAFFMALAARQRTAWIVVFSFASVDRDHSDGITRVGEGKIVRTPFDEHHKKKRHRHNGVELSYKCA